MIITAKFNCGHSISQHVQGEREEKNFIARMAERVCENCYRIQQKQLRKKQFLESYQTECAKAQQHMSENNLPALTGTPKQADFGTLQRFRALQHLNKLRQTPDADTKLLDKIIQWAMRQKTAKWWINLGKKEGKIDSALCTHALLVKCPAMTSEAAKKFGISGEWNKQDFVRKRKLAVKLIPQEAVNMGLTGQLVFMRSLLSGSGFCYDRQSKQLLKNETGIENSRLVEFTGRAWESLVAEDQHPIIAIILDGVEPDGNQQRGSEKAPEC